jgi:3-oxoacyl-[acyl-carrier protein] reductase
MTTKPDLMRLAPLRGSRIAIAGGCGGIGRALVDACLLNDLRVCVLDLQASFEQTVLPSTVTFLPFDATDEAQVDEVFRQLENMWHGLDVLVNLIGFTDEKKPVDAISPAAWDELISGNLRSAFLILCSALPVIRKAGGGSIVNTASGLAAWIRPGYGPYASAKAGLIAMTKTIAVENAPGIRANVVAPGAVDTAFLRGGTGRASKNNHAPARVDFAAYSKAIPLGRIALPDDVVGPILFLASEAACYITGQVLWVNGGSYMP